MSQTTPAPTVDDYIPLALWSKDHWSTLAYVETVLVDCAGFQVGADPRMRSNRAHFRVMRQQYPRPKRATISTIGSMGVAMDEQAHGTRLKDGTIVAKHDDWCCLQDMAHEGFFTCRPDGIEPGATIDFSRKGAKVANELREHKARGGNFGDFAPSPAALTFQEPT